MLRSRLPLVRLGLLSSRLQLGDAVRRKPWSPAAKRRNSRMRAELRRQATDVAAARCARRDATHSDAFEQRFLLRASHPLRETHMIVQKLKLQSMEWRGACTLSIPGPLNESEDQDDADLHAKWGK